MRGWLARRLQGVVFRLTRPVATHLSERIDAAARDTRGEVRDVAASLRQAVDDLAARQAETEGALGAVVAQLEGRFSELTGEIGRTRREIAEAGGRDTAAVIRLLVAAEANMADLRAALEGPNRDLAPARRAAAPQRPPGSRHVIYLGANAAPGFSAPAALLAALRTGLDAADDAGEGTPELWIERARAPDAPEDAGRLARDTYVRLLRGGTRSLEVLEPDDAAALRNTLDHHGRRDVSVVFRWYGPARPEPGAAEAAVRRALEASDHWVFSSQDLADAVLAAYAPSPQDRAGKHVHVHALPDQTTADPVTLAAAYRASVAAVLTPGTADPRVPP